MHDNIESRFSHIRASVLTRLTISLQAHIEGLITGEPRIDRVTARAKAVDRFVEKARSIKDGKLKYDDPFSQIQDQIGARIIVLYKSDVVRIIDVIKKYFRSIEERAVVPERDSEFSYFGHHFILPLPSDIIEDDMDEVPSFFELQIKTLFQHAWSEADHDLGYKPGGAILTSDQRRKIAFTSAQAWGADTMFDDLFQECSSKK